MFLLLDASGWIRGIARIAGIAKDRRNWKSSAVLSVFFRFSMSRFSDLFPIRVNPR
jgi:hypothetical protein